MELFAECILAFLATAGLFFLLWLFFDYLLTSGSRHQRGFVVLPFAGDGDTLEAAVSHLLRLRSSGLLPLPIVILDQGLSATGLARANALLSREPQLLLYTEHTLLTTLKKDG